MQTYLAVLSSLLLFSISDVDGTCETKREGKNCVFPFIYSRRKFTTCTSSDGDEPWCATSVDASNTMREWAYCKEECPGVSGFNKINVHPDNKAGNCKCGVPNNLRSTRIVGGKQTEIGEYPWQVALLFNGENTENQGCGGTLVSDRHVITAAHCTAGQLPSRLKVVVGDTTLAVSDDTTRFIVGVSSIRNHPNYASSNFENDISVLVLDTVLDLTKHPNIKPVCLPTSEDGKDITGRKAVVSGWGTVGSGQYQTEHLHEVLVSILGKTNCGQVSNQVTGDMVCAGVLEGGKDSCQGDSGGPLVVKNEKDNNGAATLAGVVSWGFGCAQAKYPGVYADVGYFVKDASKWLTNQLDGGQTCPPPARSTWDIAGDLSSNPVTEAPATSGPTTAPPTTTTTTTTTTEAPVDCSQDSTVPRLRAVKVERNVQTKMDCQELCQGNEACEYWTWYNRRPYYCVLYTVKLITRNRWSAGPKDCPEE